MTKKLPDLSRFELECLRLLWDEEEATVRDIHGRLDDPPTYSTVRKIVERLEAKGAIERVRRDGKAWVYRPAVPRGPMIRREIRRFLDSLFDGSAEPLVAHLAEMDALSLDDLREIERLARSASEGEAEGEGEEGKAAAEGARKARPPASETTGNDDGGER